MKFLLMALMPFLFALTSDEALETIRSLKSTEDHIVFSKKLREVDESWNLPESAHLEEQATLIDSLSGDVSKKRLLESMGEVASLFNQRRYRQRVLVNDFLEKVSKLDYKSVTDLKIIKKDLEGMIKVIEENSRMRDDVKKVVLASLDDAKWTLENTTLLSFFRIKKDILEILQSHVPEPAPTPTPVKEVTQPEVSNVSQPQDNVGQELKAVEIEKNSEKLKPASPPAPIKKTQQPPPRRKKKQDERLSFKYLQTQIMTGNKKVLSYVVGVPILLLLFGFIFLGRSKKDSRHVIKKSGDHTQDKVSILPEDLELPSVVTDQEGYIVEFNPLFKEQFFSYIGEYGNWGSFFKEHFHNQEDQVFSFKNKYFQVFTTDTAQHIIYQIKEVVRDEQGESLSQSSEAFNLKDFMSQYLREMEMKNPFPQGLKMSSDSHFVYCKQKYLKDIRDGLDEVCNILGAFQKAKRISQGELSLFKTHDSININATFRRSELTQDELHSIESIDGSRYLIDLLKSIKYKSALKISSKVKSLKSEHTEKTVFSFQFNDPNGEMTKSVSVVNGP